MRGVASSDHPVMLEIAKRKRLEQDGKNPSLRENTKLGLVVEGGGMRGVYSGGVMVALEQLGLKDLFDCAFAESAGAYNISYLYSNQVDLGITVYTEALSTRKFANPFRLGKMLDIDYVIDEVVRKTKRLDTQQILNAKPDIFVSVTDVENGEARIVDIKKEKYDVYEVLKASSAIIPLYNYSVELGGKQYVDGGITDPIPVLNAVNAGCTHILVALTRGPGFTARPYSPLKTFVLKRMLRKWPSKLVDAFFEKRWRGYNRSRDIAFGESDLGKDVHIAVVAPDEALPKVNTSTISRELLDEAQDESIERTKSLFESLL